jgi:hypothetical protein
VTASRSPRLRRARRLALGVLAVTALLPAAVAEAKPPQHQVDPMQMVPTLNPSFAPWTCWKAGSGITCQGEVDSTYVNQPLGLFCDGQEVYLTGRESSKMTRWHTADGRATKTVIHSNYDDEFSLSPDGGEVGFLISVRLNQHYVYAVPGDVSSRTLTQVGAILLGRAPGGGPLLVQDTGTVTFAPGADGEVVVSSGGVHEATDPAAVDAAICDALT